MALAFADAWHAATGLAGTVTTEERLYRLGMLQPPAGVGGAHREAADADTALLVDWVEQFFVETFSHQRDDTAGRRFIDNANAVGDRFVLWNDDGSPVSMAMLRAPIGRRLAYRSGLHSAGLARTRLRRCGDGRGGAAGARCRPRRWLVVLFADLANPTSNAIYQRIGFDAVAQVGQGRVRGSRLTRCRRTRHWPPRTVALVARTKTRTSGGASNRFWKLLGASTDGIRPGRWGR